MKTRFFTLIVLLALLGLTDCNKDEEEVIEPSRVPTGTFTDPRDGQVYNTINIGTQVWFAENLNYETSNSNWYNDDSANGDIYGRLYNLDEALIACPTGWHLPSDDEWKILEMKLGMSQNEADQEGARGDGIGRKLKSTSEWSNNGNGTNSSGFNGLPGGYSHGSSSDFHLLYFEGYWYTSTEYPNTSEVYSRRLAYNISGVDRDSGPSNIWVPDLFIPYNLSIRCIKD